MDVAAEVERWEIVAHLVLGVTQCVPVPGSQLSEVPQSPALDGVGSLCVPVVQDRAGGRNPHVNRDDAQPASEVHYVEGVSQLGGVVTLVRRALVPEPAVCPVAPAGEACVI